MLFERSGAACHQWNEKLVDGQRHSEACQNDEYRGQRRTKVQRDRHANENRGLSEHGKPGNRDLFVAMPAGYRHGRAETGFPGVGHGSVSAMRARDHVVASFCLLQRLVRWCVLPRLSSNGSRPPDCPQQVYMQARSGSRRVCCDDGTFAHRDTADDDGTGGDPYIFFDHDGLGDHGQQGASVNFM